MRREFHRWYSPRLKRDMELLVFGHSGARVLVFPTSMGRYFEWEDRGLVQALGGMIDRGAIQLYCVDAIDRETWYNYGGHPNGRAWWHGVYDQYVFEEVLPLSRSLNPNPFMIVTGASFGAYHAVNFAFRHPEAVGRVIGMSGLYDISRFTDGDGGGEVFYQNPVSYIAHEHDERRLALLRRMSIILAIGRDDRLRESNERLSGLLWSKGIGNALRIWDGLSHDWPYWAKMLHLYLGGAD